MRRGGARAGFWIAASVAGVGLWTSAAPSLNYPVYAERWHLSAAASTGVFAAFPIGLVVVLLFFGNLADRIGGRNTMLIGLSCSLLGGLCLALAPVPAWLYVGRALMGVGVGLTTSPAAATMVQFSDSARASVTNTVSTAIGVVLSALIGGVLIQYSPWPLSADIWVLCVAVVVVLVLTTKLPDPGTTARSFRPSLPSIPKGYRFVFVAGSSAVFTAFGVGALMFSLGSTIGKQLIGSTDALVVGADVALFAIVIALAAVVARRLSVVAMTVLGSASAVAGLAALVLGATLASLPIFFAASVLLGVAYSMLFTGALSLLTGNTPAEFRAGVLSAMYLVGYSAQAATSLGLGSIATGVDLEFALVIGATALAAFAVLTDLLVVPALARSRAPAGRRHGPRQPHGHEEGEQP